MGECFARKFIMYLYTPTETGNWINDEPAATLTYIHYPNILCGNNNNVTLKFLTELSVKEKALLMAVVL
jgi:hypothetical protein